jgi:hypothetical protein
MNANIASANPTAIGAGYLRAAVACVTLRETHSDLLARRLT